MFIAKKEMVGRWVAIMDRIRTDRNLNLNHYQTRCVVAGEIHEFITCVDVKPAGPIHHVGYLGFGEFLSAGVIAVGDELWVGDDLLLGHVLGFDETHMPNHQNIVFRVADVVTGAGSGLVLDKPFSIRFPHKNHSS